MLHNLYGQKSISIYFLIKKKRSLCYFQQQFETKKSEYDTLRKSVVHNDANDNNIIVSDGLINPFVKAAIDYGDASLHTNY